MYTIKTLTESTLLEATEAWNSGFEGYFFDATTTPERFMNRMANEGLSPDLSLIAFDCDRPIGLVLSGIRKFQNRKIAWNGGTGVSKEYRGKGIGKLLINKALDIYREQGVQTATLEAISQNKSAIKLYEKCGYVITDRLEMLALNGPQDVEIKADVNWTTEKTIPQQVGKLDFYQGEHPWQTQWQSARDGEAFLVFNENSHCIGYAVFKRIFQEDQHVATVLYQCEAVENCEQKVLLLFLLKKVFGDFRSDIKRTIINVPFEASSLLSGLLKELGFRPNAEQVYMKLTF